MRFDAARIKNVDTGAEHHVFLPKPTEVERQAGRDKLTTVQLGRQSIAMPSGLIRIVAEFGFTDRERFMRASLLHDCAVFALACSTDDPQTNVPFRQGVDRYVNVTDFEVHEISTSGVLHDPDLEVGEIAFIANRSPETPGFDFSRPETANIHFMVVAAHDPNGTVYLSKFGAIGPVAAHRLTGALNAYPARAVGQVSGLYAGPAA